MSTRSWIAVEQEIEPKDMNLNRVQNIYCHFDGYIEGVGVILLKHWNNLDKAHSLLQYGDIRNVPEQEDNESLQDVAYDKIGISQEHTSEYHMMLELRGDIHIEYVYLFKNNNWYVSELRMQHEIPESYFGYTSLHTKFKLLQDVYNKLQESKTYCEECPEETEGFYLCDDCEEEQFNKDEEENNRD
tara:strand:- start:1773 stop:2333 length:561 start_codon:yes stop_codon:yes gene_type:complete